MMIIVECYDKITGKSWKRQFANRPVARVYINRCRRSTRVVVVSILNYDE